MTENRSAHPHHQIGIITADHRATRRGGSEHLPFGLADLGAAIDALGCRDIASIPLIQLEHMGVHGRPDLHGRRGFPRLASGVKVGSEIMQRAAAHLVEVAFADRWVGVVGGVVHRR